jgi:hypothetical protein
MENKFQWNDETVKEFVLFYNSHSDLITGVDPIMDKEREFKQMRTSEQKPKWEIILFVRGGLNWLLNNGRYHNELGGYHDVMPVNNTEIKKVRRLSDNEIISVGETKIRHNVYADGLLVDKIELKIKDEWQQILVYAGGKTFILDYLRVFHSPLFQINGEDIFEGQEVWCVNGVFAVFVRYQITREQYEDLKSHCRFFITEDLANDWVIWNKPQMSLAEVMAISDWYDGQDETERRTFSRKKLKELAILKTGSADR